MKINVMIAAILLVLSLPVAADWERPQESHEARLSELRLPQNDAGTVGFKPCADCAYVTKRVNANTEWVLDGQRMSLKDFKRNLRRISDREGTPVTVVENLELEQVTRVSVHPVSSSD